MSVKLKSAFRKAHSISPLYTGGPIAVSTDGKRLVTCVSEEAILTDVQSGLEICRFTGDTQNITSLCVTPSSTHLILFTSAQALRVYELPKCSTSDRLLKPTRPIRVVARAHDAPVHVCTADPTSTYLASGSADGVVKVWDILRGHVTHLFKGHGGVVSALHFSFPRDPSNVSGVREQMHLITASVDTRIRVFDLSASAARTAGALKPVAVLEGHVSVPRGLDVTDDGKWLVSGGRDSVVLLWDLSSISRGDKSSKGKGKASAPSLVKTIPALERVEALGILRTHEDTSASSSADASGLQFYTAGEKGVVRIWEAHEGSVLYTLGDELDQSNISDEDEEQRQIVEALYVPSQSTIITVHADQNILFHDLNTRRLSRQLIGFNDEIVDAAYLSGAASSADTHLALATNSSLIRVYTIATRDAHLLSGHTEIVLCLDTDNSGQVFASGSKDRSARIWAPTAGRSGSDRDQWNWGCVGVCEGHAESVGALAFSRQQGDKERLRFMFTGSQDRTIKMWDLSDVSVQHEDGSEPRKCTSLTTHKAHDKDINSLDAAPDDRLLASGSQDRTAKIFSITYAPASGPGRRPKGELKLVGTCRGHKRGVWCVRFSRSERVLATGSGDKSVRLWRIDDCSCVATFEGHTNAVLRVDWMAGGRALVSAASDGLVKVWSVRGEECLTTLDGHEDKVWALAVSRDERTIVSGAADSVVNFWEDCTEEEEREKEAQRADVALKEQDFSNYIALRDYRKAIQLALAMSQPGRLLSLFTSLQSSSASASSAGSITGHVAVDEVIRTLPGSDLAQLLRHARTWNANARTSGVAQGVLHAVMKLRKAEDVMQAFADASITPGDLENTQEAGPSGGTALKELVDGLIPYTERHLARMDRLLQESYVVDYLLGEMDDGVFHDESGLDGAMDVDTAAVIQV